MVSIKIKMDTNSQSMTSAFYDWYNAYFEIQFQLHKLADGTAYGAD